MAIFSISNFMMRFLEKGPSLFLLGGTKVQKAKATTTRICIMIEERVLTLVFLGRPTCVSYKQLVLALKRL